MAWFISFYREIPEGTPSRDKHQYHITGYQIDHSLVDENTKPPQDEIDRFIKRFEAERGVKHWRDAAHSYSTSEYDND